MHYYLVFTNPLDYWNRTTLAIHPLVKRIGVSGRDVTRIVMGFGCNVPAVINSRSCSSCSRGNNYFCNKFWFCMFCTNLVHLLPASGMPWLVIPFLIYLTGNDYSLHSTSQHKEKSLQAKYSSN